MRTEENDLPDVTRSVSFEVAHFRPGGPAEPLPVASATGIVPVAVLRPETVIFFGPGGNRHRLTMCRASVPVK